jgi:hypothetical protein
MPLLGPAMSVVGPSVPRMDDDLTDLDKAGLLAAASAAVRARRLAEVRDLEVLLEWSRVHSGEPDDPHDRLMELAGEGTPAVQEMCLGEIALARGTGATATVNALVDTLNLVHRMPETWKVVQTGAAEVHIARRVARISSHLPLAVMPVVDTSVARIIAHESGGRVLDVAEAKIIEADPDRHEARVEAERRRRYVSSSRTDEFGLRTVIARCEAGDVVWIEATLTRVVEIIAPQHPGATADELRSIAFGWLARPAELLTLLLEHRDEQETLDLRLGDDSVEAPDETADIPHSRAMAMPADLLDALRDIDLTPLAPKAVLYVHLHEAAVAGAAAGVARVEGLGPRTYASLAELLSRTDLVVKPVIDLHVPVRTTAYEHPEALKERVHLLSGGDYWPYATSTSRAVDYDHPTPYDADRVIRGGPPEQTGTHNSGPLGRRHHRWKTHGGYRSRQCGPGRYVWLTPHGLGFLVDHRGTRRISAGEARLIIDAPPGLDIYGP